MVSDAVRTFIISIIIINITIFNISGIQQICKAVRRGRGHRRLRRVGEGGGGREVRKWGEAGGLKVIYPVAGWTG